MSSKKVQLGEIIKSVRIKHGLNQEGFALSLGVTTNTITRYEKGHRFPDSDFLIRLVEIYKCDPVLLLTGEKSIEKSKAEGEADHRIINAPMLHNEDFIYIPQVSGEISAGNGLVPDNTIEIRIAFRKDWIARKGDPQHMSLIRVSGDSMDPTLLSGDLILIDHSRNYIDPQGGIYAISIDHTIMIKRLQLLYPAQKIRIISDNNRYDTIETDPAEIKINGKVIWFGREVER